MAAPSTANDRFKRRATDWTWLGVTLATALHAVIFAASPVFATDGSTAMDERAIEVVVPRIELPPPPAEIQRPARPVFDVADVDPLTTMEPNIPAPGGDHVLAPPAPAGDEADRAPRVTPMEVRPRLLNPAEVQEALRRHYPTLLRDAGIGGVTRVWFFIDAEGRAVRTQLDRSSGYEALDRAALEVAEVMEFSPALNRDRRVAVWVSLDIKFEVQ